MRAERCRSTREVKRARVPADAASTIEDLRFIRRTMESAGSFTAVSGWGMMAVGGVALLSAGVAEMQDGEARQTLVWVMAAVIAASISVAANAQKSARSQHSASKAVLRKFLLAFLPPLFTGAVLTVLLAGSGLWAIIPAMWMLMYGTAVLTGGVFSVRLVPAMGACFLVAGLVAVFLPASVSNWAMAAAFGGLHLMFGGLIARRHGG